MFVDLMFVDLPHKFSIRHPSQFMSASPKENHTGSSTFTIRYFQNQTLQDTDILYKFILESPTTIQIKIKVGKILSRCD